MKRQARIVTVLFTDLVKLTFPVSFFLTFAIPYVVIVYVQTLYGSLINLRHFCKIFFILLY